MFKKTSSNDFSHYSSKIFHLLYRKTSNFVYKSTHCSKQITLWLYSLRGDWDSYIMLCTCKTTYRDLAELPLSLCYLSPFLRMKGSIEWCQNFGTQRYKIWIMVITYRTWSCETKFVFKICRYIQRQCVENQQVLLPIFHDNWKYKRYAKRFTAMEIETKVPCSFYLIMYDCAGTTSYYVRIQLPIALYFLSISFNPKVASMRSLSAKRLLCFSSLSVYIEILTLIRTFFSLSFDVASAIFLCKSRQNRSSCFGGYLEQTGS